MHGCFAQQLLYVVWSLAVYLTAAVVVSVLFAGTGDLLCEVLNKLRPGLVPKYARTSDMQGLHPSKAHAKMRENIGQYVDGCAELGTPSAHRPVMCPLREHTAMPLSL